VTSHTRARRSYAPSNSWCVGAVVSQHLSRKAPPHCVRKLSMSFVLLRAGVVRTRDPCGAATSARRVYCVGCVQTRLGPVPCLRRVRSSVGCVPCPGTLTCGSSVTLVAAPMVACFDGVGDGVGYLPVEIAVGYVLQPVTAFGT
jgi:hypothetical protein